MIYYFSGTGNSREVAERIAHEIHDDSVCITAVKNKGNCNHQTIGFIFPVYAWGMPRVMEKFIRDFDFSNKPSYCYMVCTCGDDIGYTDRTVRKLLQSKGVALNAAWSVIMPNTYIALPGFDVDSEALARLKLRAAFPRIQQIADAVIQKQRNITDVRPGAFAGIKSNVLRPFFNKFLIGDHKFSVSDSCVHCGKCAHTCPMQNITYDKNGLPTWNGNCADCLACYHSCPVHAINFGPFTRNKGQYLIKNFLKAFKL